MSDAARVLIISPVRNEAEHIERLAGSLARQTRPPDLWLVADDGSTDGTPELLERLAERIPFLRVVATPPGLTADARDRHTVAASPRAFNWALSGCRLDGVTHLGKLDGDIELPPEYFARLLREFDADPALGIAGGVLVEEVGGEWKLIQTAPHHVRGAVKLYRRECFDAIGGLRELLGWDGIDQSYARMQGWTTRSFDAIVARHHRACGSADGLLRGRVRGGATHWVVGFSFPWVLAKAVRAARMRPVGLSGLAFLYGYLRAALASAPRVEDPRYRRFVRDDERRRVRGAAGTAVRRLRPRGA